MEILMKKLLLSSSIIIMQFWHNNCACSETLSQIAINSRKIAKMALAAAIKIKNNQAQKGFFENVKSSVNMAGGIAATVGTFTVTVKQIQSYFFTQKSNEVNQLICQQERDFIVARKALIDLLHKNNNGIIGIYGLPKECEEATRNLVLLPGGYEEVEKIKKIFHLYFLKENNDSQSNCT